VGFEPTISVLEWAKTVRKQYLRTGMDSSGSGKFSFGGRGGTLVNRVFYVHVPLIELKD
jgi:hypothetical protein